MHIIPYPTAVKRAKGRGVASLLAGIICFHATSLLAAPLTAVQANEFLNRAMGESVSVKETFAAPMGLTGVVVNTSQVKNIVMYVDEAMRHFIVGMIFDAEGRNLTAQYVTKNMPDSALDAVVSQLEAMQYIEEGHPNAPLVYVFADPNCPYCAKLHEMVDRDLRDGKLRIRWILTSSLGHDGKAEAVYSLNKRMSGQGAEMLRQYYKGIGEKSPEYDEYGAKAVAEANRYFNDMGLKGTPFLMYRTRSGSVGTHMGLPDENTYRQIVSVLPDGK